jgi:hypothetical protein
MSALSIWSGLRKTEVLPVAPDDEATEVTFGGACDPGLGGGVLAGAGTDDEAGARDRADPFR